jgi:ferritin-like metal-binding protein YciE
MQGLQELLVDGLRDIYDAEKQLVRALPKLTRALSNSELKDAFTQHLEVTKNQVARVEQCFEVLGEKAKSKPCRAMKGLVEEAQEHLQEHEKGELLDQVLVGAGQKVEHYEIAAYGTARAMAKSLGQKEAMNLLQETLREEEQMDKALTAIALRLQREMGRSKPDEDMEAMSNGRGSRTAGRSSGSGSRGGGAKKKVVAGSRSTSTSSGRSASTRGGQQTESRSASKRASAGGSGRTASGRNGGSRGGAGSRVLTDHEQIREWAEERGAHPSCVRGTGNKGDIGMLRLDFPGYTGEDKLEEISWDEFFEKFDERDLSLLVQDKTARGQKSNFNKLVSRETASASKGGGRSRSAARG